MCASNEEKEKRARARQKYPRGTWGRSPQKLNLPRKKIIPRSKTAVVIARIEF